MRALANVAGTVDWRSPDLEIKVGVSKGLVPLVVPITLVNRYVARFDLAYVQVYLRPHPQDLMLRNHV